ncbi:MAG: TlpA family protein disulfide reductase [Bacteroidales bacterium]
MRNHNLLTVNFFILFASLLNSAGQSAIIKGSGEGYEGVKLLFYRESDPVSRKLLPLQIVRCGEKGEFSAEIPLKGTSLISIKSGIYNFKLLVYEGKRLEVKLPPYIPMPPGAGSNPFVAERTVIPEVLSDTNDINNLMRVFDSEYNPVFNMVSERISKSVKKEEIPGIIERLNRLTGYSDNSFYNDFVQYRIIMLNIVAHGQYPGRREDSIFINRRFVPENPAYTDLIEQLYGNCFRVIMTGPLQEYLTDALNRSSPAEIMKVLTQDGKIINPMLQQYVILMNTYYDYYNGFLREENITGILDSLATGGDNEYIKNLASVLKERISDLSPGTYPPAFELPDSTGKIMKPGDFRGKYLLLVFIRDTDYASMSEMALLKSWLEKFKENLNLVAVLTGNNYYEMLSYFSKRGYRWIFLNGTDSPFLTAQYEIRVYPSFLLLNTEGKIAVKYCPLPSENLEGFLRNIFKKQGK